MKKVRGIFLKNDLEIASMREAGRIVAIILRELREAVKPGVKTMVFEEIARKRCDDFKVKPAFLGMYGFPYALCCSVNEEVVHGFPSERVLVDGDLVSFDMGVVYDGFYGDSATTVPVGAVNGDREKLLRVTKESLEAGIAEARAGNDLYDISRAVQKYVEEHGLSVVRRFVGHGIGRKLHEKPEIPNFEPKGAPRVPLLPGMVLAIEPMVTAGGPDVEVLSDNWTAVTKDRSLSAHFEHTVAVTKNGPRILSLAD
ncbi:methionine aminopeptidase, type I [Solidesulfovibrio carbinoliphilus subsp. oakridgensis]|uniref:Methionine aminopeptidase n=1 Tax=Solidesulfovibrio carbinoliphilus subsp. oakridgensis TaxID=694327 RepID=G7Q9V9_9BACT|nr:type I methionyl aminopeptidase [Solidesulfovibrio carbinoliphilus]EHJ49225.1 methionine aminopeptidase, type I [Solidesulfovibrio carbinoliphilus subsp. oakridgensis]